MKQNKRSLILWLVLIVVLAVASVLTGTPGGESESVKAVMRDAVLHETGQVSLFGIMDVNPGLISAYVVTAALLVLAVCLRIFAVPHFTEVPGKLQMLLELWVDTFRGMAEKNSPHNNKVLGPYLFGAGTYIFVSTLFELLGVQVVTTAGHSLALPAPLSDVNAAIAMGVLSYLFIMSGGVSAVGIRGVGRTLKEFSLPISMSFRLFGALLSGLLVTELVYYYITLSYVLPVIVGVMFTMLHSLIQSYVLTMLVALYYGEVSEPVQPKVKKNKKNSDALAA
ncbi:F0F1 ATP synthase subunit A [Faecalibacterium sp. An122]|uniref:F0F1 ATP synthase subunit A n=1 Tax=Faecalibacterium sp. An122 TaxID=1965551 RepID=UPI000B3ABFBA|nr:F0F1 ATP synthase subunit A [Faecalibacterium sp. An122]OUQ39322.1 hypothetical protein B5E67_02070 [Faecalibacterium sp. An122]